MAEPQKMVHLTPAQKKRKKFSHPLTDKAPSLLTEEWLNQLLLVYFATDEEDELHIEIGKDLMMNYLRLLRSSVACYLYYWPVTRRFLDEMVSSGAEAIAKVIVKLEPEQLKKRNLGYWIGGAIRLNIETTINNLRGVVSASRPTNFYREQVGKKPIYGNVEADLNSDNVKDSKEYNDIGSFIFEIKDAIEIIARTKLEKQILAQENWGLSDIELSSKLNISPQYVGRIRNCLHDRYMKLGEKHV